MVEETVCLVCAERVTLAPAKTARTPRQASVRFDAIMTALSTWFMLGLMLDAWAHSNLEGLESFFTPWHAVFYSGFTAVTFWVGYAVFWNVRSGHSIVESIPVGYRATAIAIPAFAVFGTGDMLWHIVFGVETDLNILFSPTHLGLAASMLFILTSPVRAAWARTDLGRHTSLRQLWPALLSTGLATALILLFVSYGDALRYGALDVFFSLSTNEDHLASRLAARVLITTTVLLLPVLLVIKRWQLPPGAALLCGLPAIGITAAQTAGSNPEVLGAAILAFVAADVLLQVWKPSTDRRFAYYGFAGTTALLLWVLYIATALLTEGAPDIIEMWTGLPIVATMWALLLAFVVAPTPAPTASGPE